MTHKTRKEWEAGKSLGATTLRGACCLEKVSRRADRSLRKLLRWTRPGLGLSSMFFNLIFLDTTEGWTCQGPIQPSGSQQHRSHHRLRPHVSVLYCVGAGRGVQKGPGTCVFLAHLHGGLVWESGKTPSPPSHPLLWPWEREGLGLRVPCHRQGDLYVLPTAVKKPSSCVNVGNQSEE